MEGVVIHGRVVLHRGQWDFAARFGFENVVNVALDGLCKRGIIADFQVFEALGAVEIRASSANDVPAAVSDNCKFTVDGGQAYRVWE